MAFLGIRSVNLAANAVILLLLAAFQVPIAHTTSSTFGFCFDQIQECQLDTECAQCLLDWGPDNSDSSTCVEEYATLSTTSSTATDTCASRGASYCCFFVSGTANSCMESAVMIDYWSCIQEANECTLDDMPCYGSSFVEDTGGTTRDGVGTLSGALLATVAAAILAV
ncbi:unnamed protein product [Ascophyllum nodosum]